MMIYYTSNLSQCWNTGIEPYWLTEDNSENDEDNNNYNIHDDENSSIPTANYNNSCDHEDNNNDHADDDSSKYNPFYQV